jgi:hypothetical protein
MTIRHNCRKQGCYLDILPDWAMLDGCFGDTKVKPSDGDGQVHQNGAILFLEKKFPNAVIEPPLRRTIDTHIRQGNSFIAFWCEKKDGSDISKMRVFGIEGYDSDMREATLQDFRAAVKKWWQAHYQSGKV